MDLLAISLGLGSGGAVMWILKKIHNEKICSVVEGLFCKMGTVMTAGLTKWKPTRKIWNKTVEPYFVDLIDNVFGSAVRGLIKGLRSDN